MIGNTQIYCQYPVVFRQKRLSPDEVQGLLALCDCAWMHDGDVLKPHAELSSGMCSNGFFDVEGATDYPNICEILGHQLYMKLREQVDPKDFDCVVGSSYAAIKLSYEAAKSFGIYHPHYIVRKDPTNPKKFVWTKSLPKRTRILRIEELITTSNTFRGVTEAIVSGNPEPVEFLPIVGTVVHRPPLLPVDYGDVQVVSLLEKQVWAVKPDMCDLCKAGSPRLKPRGASGNWQKLVVK